MSADPLAAPTRGPGPRASGRPPRLHRLPSRGYAGGVCAGLADYFAADPLLFRIGFVVLAAFGGSGVALYVLAWALVPAAVPSDPTGRAGFKGRVGALRALAAGAWREAAGIALIVLAGLVLLRQLGFWPGDAIVWPLVLASSGLALVARQLWGTGAPAETLPSAGVAPSPAAPAPPVASRAAPVSHTVAADPEASSPAFRGDAAAPLRSSRPTAGAAPVASVPGGLLGAMLIVGAAVVFLQATGTLAALREALVGIVVVVIVLGLVFGPWMARQARSLAAERAERIRSQERAELAAHLHDSVLQTLALIQRRSGDARTVGTLARRQERELRQWLGGVAPTAAETSLAAALSAAAQEIEELHGVEVEVVTVGDRPLDDRLRALVGAAREAMANAARFSGADKVDLYAEVTEASVQAFVRDRGAGFDPAGVPADRRGLRESIIGRMERHDGRARVESAPGEGTEVELTMEHRS